MTSSELWARGLLEQPTWCNERGRMRVRGSSWWPKMTSLSHLHREKQRDAIREAELLRSLSHPNVVDFVDSFVEESGSGSAFLYIIMGCCGCGRPGG